MAILEELTATPQTFVYEGETYTLAILTVNDWALLKQRYKEGLANDPLAIVKPHLEGLSVELQKILLEKAYEDARLGQRLRPGELDEWLRTVEGGHEKFYLSLLHRHPGMTRDKALVLFEAHTQQRWQEFQRDLKKLEGLPEALPEINPTKPKANPDTSSGQESSRSWLASITGLFKKSAG